MYVGSSKERERETVGEPNTVPAVTAASHFFPSHPSSLLSLSLPFDSFFARKHAGSRGMDYVREERERESEMIRESEGEKRTNRSSHTGSVMNYSSSQKDDRGEESPPSDEDDDDGDDDQTEFRKQ